MRDVAHAFAFRKRLRPRWVDLISVANFPLERLAVAGKAIDVESYGYRGAPEHARLALRLEHL